MIVALATHLDRTLDQKLRALDTSVAQWKVLSALSNGRAESAADLARLFGADTGALTRLLDRMESAELLARRPHPHDRRQHQLALTRRGQALMKQVPPLIVDDLNTRLAAFTPAEVGQLKTLLRKLMDGSRPLGLSVGPPERTEATEG